MANIVNPNQSYRHQHKPRATMKSFTTSVLAVVLAPLTLYHTGHAWQGPMKSLFQPAKEARAKATMHHDETDTDTQRNNGRRMFLNQISTVTFAVVVGATASSSTIQPAWAMGSAPSSAELVKLQKGLSRVQYLLKNWDTETQICGKVVMSDTERKQVVRTEGTCS